MKKSMKSFGLVAVLLGISIGLYIGLESGATHRINNESYEQILKGMTESEVERLLGGPYGQYCGGIIRVIYPGGPRNSPCIFLGEKLSEDILNCSFWVNGEIFFQRKGWVAADLSIWVWFDEEGRVTEKRRFPVNLQSTRYFW